MAKKKRQDGRLTYWLLTLLIILFAGSLFLLKELQSQGKSSWRLPEWLGGHFSLTSKSLKLEERINNALAESGVTDAAVVSFNNSEKTDGGDRWYYFEKQLKLPPHLNIVNIQQALVKSVVKAGGKVLENRLTNKSDEKILFFKAGLEQRLTHYLVLGQLSVELPERRPQVALIIDDIGNNEDIRFFDELDIPLTMAILPQLNFSSFSAQYAIKQKDVPFLHLPLEPVESDKNPGPGVITTTMSEQEIIETLDKNLQSVPGVVGVNGHMGSLATQDRRVMEIILKYLQKRGLIFVDSLVVKTSVGQEIAEKIGLNCLTRDVFIDNLDEVSYVKGQLRQLIDKALEKGRAIGIGHIYHESTRTAIKEMLPIFAKEGVVFVPITEFL